MCADTYSPKFVSDCQVKLQEMWYEELDKDGDLVEGYNGYKQCAAEKAQKLRVNAYCLASHKNARLVYGRR